MGHGPSHVGVHQMTLTWSRVAQLTDWQGELSSAGADLPQVALVGTHKHHLCNQACSPLVLVSAKHPRVQVPGVMAPSPSSY